MVFSFLEYLFSFQRYSRFCILSDDVRSGSTNTVQHSIKNISRSTRAVVFKLGNINVHHKRNKINISRTKKDIPKTKTPFFFTLKSLSNRPQLFFTFIGNLKSLTQQC